MSRHLLAVDIGNTQTTVGLFVGAQLRERWRMATRVARTSDEIWVLTERFLSTLPAEARVVEAVAVASVVPELTRAYRRMATERLRVQTLIITSEHVRSLRIAYDPPSSVGADRLCGAAAAYHEFGGPLVIVDLGTATVFDAVDRTGTYLGGAIAPGLQTAVESLHREAAQLPRADISFPESVIGRNTHDAIRAGVMFGAVAMIDGIVEQMRSVFDGAPHVVATGGFAELVQTRSRTIQHVRPDLVLEGIRLVFEQQ